MENKEVFDKNKMYFGRCLGSKTSYTKAHPSHFVIYNARIYTKEYYEAQKHNEITDWFKGQENEIWYGDIDFNKDIKKLVDIQNDLAYPIVITTEHGQKIMEISYR